MTSPLDATPRGPRAALAAVVLLVLVGIDQLTKKLAITHLEDTPMRSYLGDTFRLDFARNSGAFLSLGSTLPDDVRFWLLTVVNGLFLVGLGVFLVLRWDMPLVRFVAVVLMFAGGIGNLIDRLVFDGHVTDFLNVGIGPVRTGIFNVADMAITGGVILLVLFRSHDDANEDESREASPREASATAASADAGSPDRASPDGASPDRASPDGASPDRASPGRASPDGVFPDEAPDEETPAPRDEHVPPIARTPLPDVDVPPPAPRPDDDPRAPGPPASG